MRERKISAKLFAPMFAAALCLLLSATASAQSTATVQGTVTDQQGAVVPNAKVVVHSNATGLERTAQTDSDGNYQIASIPPGVYRVEIQAQGFQGQSVGELNVDVARTVVQNFQLTVGQVSQSVTVTSDAPVVETATTSVGTVINQRTVQEIPLNGRHFVDLGLLLPGSVTPPQNGFLSAPLRGQGSFAFNTAGNREDTVNFQINGVNLNDMVQNQITFQPSINTVQEFKADNSTFSAEYGRNSGAVVNIATRSGTNEFHGELFEFLRNDALDARNFFDLKKPPFRRNQFGFAVGGPVPVPDFRKEPTGTFHLAKNKTFFFFSYEGLRQRQGLSLNSLVLSDAQRASVTNPVIARLIQFIPRANVGSTTFIGSATAPVNIDQETIDISHTVSAKDAVHGYYAFQHDFRGEPNLQGNTIPGFGDTRQSRRQIFTLNETHTFSAALVNEARFGFNRIHITFTPNNELNPADFGINEGIDQSIGLPQINVSGNALNFGGPSGFPQGRGDTTFVGSDTLAYQWGNHSLKFGGEFRRFLNNNFNLDNGAFVFPSVASFIAGNASSFTITLGDRPSSISQGALGAFVQDNYKVRRNLTLELGLRYDWNMSPTERYDRFVVFDPASDSLVRVNNGIAPVYHTNNKNFQPRLGFAWDPFKDGKTSLRGAYAVLVDQPVTNVVTPVSANPPLATPLTVTTAGTGLHFDNALTAAGAAGLAPQTVDDAFDNAYVQSWNLNAQREVMRGLGLTIGYFGSKGTHLRISRNINQPVGGVRPFVRLSSSSPILPGALLNNITQIESTGNSSYNALWITAEKRLSRGLQFNTSYTWSKSIDYNSLNSQGIIVQNSYDLRNSRGLSDYDARHRFVFSTIYGLPFRGDRLVNGWQLGAIVQAQSGNPVNIITSISAFNGVANTLRPDVTGTPTIIGDVNRWFDTSVFVNPTSPVTHFGSLGRNVIIGPGFNNTDFSVIKNTKLTETTTVQFRTEFFDVFNHPNFGQPGRTVGSATFGKITNTRFATGDSGSSRQIQFALKLLF
ncbi:MAG TPA: TonB-dependent receptor [Pyrinomonadaceae bacterium]|nr:TonB-dependent receptor [Pyrinomonadaceae bacterium]